jgi:hypothetical protein
MQEVSSSNPGTNYFLRKLGDGTAASLSIQEVMFALLTILTEGFYGFLR